MMSDGTWYIYCIAEGAQPPAVESGLEVVTCGDVHAVVRPAAPQEFEGVEPDGEGDLPAHLTELLFRHDQVIRGVFARHDLLPMRFGMGVAGRDGLARYLAQEYGALKAGLDRVRGQAEWGVRWQPPVAEQAPVPSAPVTGRGYLQSRKQALRAGQDRLRGFRNHVEGAHRRLAQRASAICPGAPGSDEISCAYLVRRDRVDGFLRTVEALEAGAEAVGVGMRLSGPWPPYSFASGLALGTASTTEA
jgi:hypothetical protein